MCVYHSVELDEPVLPLDLSALPQNAPDLLNAPTATTPVFIAISLAFTFIFFFLFTLTALRSKLGKMGPIFDKPSMQRYTAWIGLFGFMIGKSVACYSKV
jgi:hypothetical protein